MSLPATEARGAPWARFLLSFVRSVARLSSMLQIASWQIA
jgi:hypothetical protein